MGQAHNEKGRRRLAVIGCGVLEWNVKRVAARLPQTEIIQHTLPAQLHNNPRRLREFLQAEIDVFDADTRIDAVCLAYGVCGRGTVGLFSRSKPLVIPRAQDCIAISLGSHARYLEEFQRRPGTKYMTQGWYETTVAVTPPEQYYSGRERSLYQTSREQLVQRYGEDNAAFICQFRESWQRNYQRAAYIRFAGEGERPPGQQISEGTAASLGWEHAMLEGDESLLEAMLLGHWNDPRLLLVPPHSKTVPAPGAAVIGFSTAFDTQAEAILAKYQAEQHQPAVNRTGIGLGIDTGGTFTDAVLYNFSTRKILAFAKAPTVHHNLVEGIAAAVGKLPAELLPQVKRVAMSTTLATNAFVERKGRPVALLLMSPVDIHLATLPFRFVRKISGAMNMEGMESEPLDEEQIRHLAREAVEMGCEAFAVSGFGSVINPRHELRVAELILETTGLYSVCGHELTSHLNFIERATTAAMNAKLIPLIESLLDAAREAMTAAGLRDVQVMVVKGDGSQMLDRVARKVPVETLLSGPAASVVGAARLFHEPDAVVADMGGTTLDVALIRKGMPVLSENGSRIGEFQTSVRGMAIHTTGLGGDSEIDLSGWPEVRIGPRRVTPVCRLPAAWPDAVKRLDTLLQMPIAIEPNVLDVVSLAPGRQSPRDKLLSCLDGSALFLLELAAKLQRPSPSFIDWQEAESQGCITRFGLTLTDLLHVSGDYRAYDTATAQRFLAAWAQLLDIDPERIIEAVQCEFRRRVADEILAASMPSDCPWKTTEGGLRKWLTAALADASNRDSEVSFEVALRSPLIPVGAPAPVLFPQLANVLRQDIRISEYAAVTNAFGAIAGDVVLQETAAVRVTENGAFLCSWRGENERAPDLAHALKICEQGLRTRLCESAEANAVPYSEPVFHVVAHQAATKEGKLFLGVTLTAELRG
jgi:N-methylhydantoinase A/oxoprolinase/acetone carboxylase beta subunit